MKTFFDRISYIGHRPRFSGKKALVLATAFGIGKKETIEYMGTMAGMWWGFEVVERVGIVTIDPAPQRLAEKSEGLLRQAAERFAGAAVERQDQAPRVHGRVRLPRAAGIDLPG